MKCVMLLLMSLSLPKIPAHLHTHLYASPKSHRPKDCKQSQIIFQWRKMSVCVYVCVLPIFIPSIGQLGRFLSLKHFKIQCHLEADWSI